MAEQARNSTTKRTKPKATPLRYFYLNGMLHRKLHINRGADQITTWCYPLGKRVAYTYSDVKRRKEPAFTTVQVARMLNRKRLAIERAIMAGELSEPQATYGLNENRKRYQYLWSEKDIMEAHELFSNRHIGRPRADGLITPRKLPTARELRAMIRQEQMLYVKNDAGEFVPVWKAEDFS